jgi:hypothetical protein
MTISDDVIRAALREAMPSDVALWLGVSLERVLRVFYAGRPGGRPVIR